MNMYRRTLSLVLLALLVSALILVPALAQVTVSTDKAVYAPDEFVTISGVADANAWVAVDVNYPLGTSIYTDTIQADALGAYSTVFRLPVTAMEGIYNVSVSITGATDSTTFNVSTGIPPLTGTLSARVRKSSFARGETVSFDVESTFPQPDSYIEISDPAGDLYWITDLFEADMWLKVGMNQTVPYYYQTAGDIPMTLPDDAPLGTWYWTFYDKTNNELGSYTFTVYTDTPTIPPVAYIDKPSKTTFYEKEIIEFRGHGTDSDGRIVGYKWETEDRNMSLLDNFTTSFNESGTHTVLFSVMDQDGIWSELVTLSLEIKHYLININGIYVQTEHVAVATGAGATTTIIAISRPPTPTPEKIQKIRNKKELKRQKKEERRNKKIKGKPFITWRVEAPNKLHCRCSKITIKLKNVGTADAKNIHIYIQSTYGLKLEKTHLHIQKLPAGDNTEETIQFSIDPVVNNGLCKIIASINTPTLLEERKAHFIWVLKTGLVKSLLKTEEQENITQWLNEAEHHWGMIEDPGNYINLMGYDLIFINDSNLSKKSINNLTIFAEMGNKVIINDTINNQDSLLLEPLGYIDLARDEVVIKTSKLEIVNSRHPLTKAYKINSIKQEAESIALVNPKLGSGKAVSLVKYKLNDVEEKAPFITMRKLEEGHMIHLNYKIVDKGFELTSITKNIVEYFLDALYNEKVIPMKGKLRKK